MPTRRDVLTTVSGGFVGGAGVYGGMSALDVGYGSVYWVNVGDDEVWVQTTIVSDGRFWSGSDVVYESDYRIFPTQHARSGDTNIVETGTYEVDVEVTSKDDSESSGTMRTTWRPAGCHHQELTIRIDEELRVEFMQNTCG